MQNSLALHKVSISVLIGIVILACVALVAESLPEVKAKIIVVPTLVLIIAWSMFFLVSLLRRK